MTGKIFINYRREESAHVAGRLHDRLAQSFGRDNIFMDVDNIPVGVDFVTHLNDQVAACDAVLVVIGPKWAKAKDKSGQRRLHQPDDFVAIEIAAALTRDIRVIPVLVDGARMPRTSELPDALKPLVRRQAAEVRHVNFGQDAETLVARMRKSLGDKTLVKGGPEAVGDKATVISELERLAAQEHEAKAEAEAEAKRKADEQLRLAAAKSEQEKQAEAEVRQQAELEARQLEAQRRSEEEAEQQRQVRAAAEAQRQADIRAEQERQKQVEAEAWQHWQYAELEVESKRLADEENRRQRAERELPIATMGKALADKAPGPSRRRVGPIVAAMLVLVLVVMGGYTVFWQSGEEERRAAAEAETKRLTNEAWRKGEQAAQQRGLFTIRRGMAASSFGLADQTLVAIPSIEQCEQQCAQRANCNVFTYNKITGYCFMFPRSDLVVRSSDFDSGVRK